MIVEKHHFIKQWVWKGGLSDHYPIFLEFNNSHVKPPSSLKLKNIWLKDEGFRALISNRWIPFNPGNRSTATFQFAADIRNLKDVIKSWAVEKRKREDSELQQIEIELFGIYNMDGGGMMNQMKKDKLIQLEGRRITLLLEKEETWRLKSRAIWLECGDDNTKFFHAYARGSKEANIVWSLVDEHGTAHDTFEGMATTGTFQEAIQSSCPSVNC